MKPNITIKRNKRNISIHKIKEDPSAMHGDDAGRPSASLGAALTETLAQKTGFSPMTMKGKVYKGYCYVEPAGFETGKDFEYWINLCLEYNDKAKSSGK